jgi:hypothetical protein
VRRDIDPAQLVESGLFFQIVLPWLKRPAAAL